MNEVYLRLGRLIAGQCTPGFREARLEAGLDGREAELRIGCTLADGREVDEALGAAAADEIRLCLESVRAHMAEDDGRRWRGCTVTLIAGGGFRMDVAY